MHSTPDEEKKRLEDFAALDAAAAASALAPSKPQAQSARCALATGCLPVSSANGLVADWRNKAKSCMKMSRMHGRKSWEAHAKHRDKESNEHEGDRYRWQRVAQTYRFCAKELRRQMAASNKRQPEDNNCGLPPEGRRAP